jgi:general secretion pathway protein G
MATSKQRRSSGFTLIELMLTVMLLVILTGLAVPMARTAIKRQKERELRYDLRLLRDAIDRYKDGADRSYFQKADSYGYPKTLQVRFLREIPVDPMTGKAEWGVHSMEDDPESDSWDETTVYDVYSKSEGTALNGSRYRTW